MGRRYSFRKREDLEMLKLTVAVLAIALAGSASAAGWRSMRIDASSEASFKTSLEAFKEKLSPARQQVLGLALQDIWTQGTKEANAAQREYTASDYYRQIDGLGYEEIVTFTDPTGDLAQMRYKVAKQDAFFESRSGSRSASAGAATPPWPVSSGPPPVQSGVYRGATRSIDNQQH
jgi:hypothetical protein